jgi:hypothetical protein
MLQIGFGRRAPWLRGMKAGREIGACNRRQDMPAAILFGEMLVQVSMGCRVRVRIGADQEDAQRAEQ